MGMVYLVPVGCYTGGDDMDMVVRRVMVGIDEQRLPLIGIPHLLEIAVRDVEQLLMRVFISLTAYSHMKLCILDMCVP